MAPLLLACGPATFVDLGATDKEAPTDTGPVAPDDAGDLADTGQAAPRCNLWVDVATPHALEGDTITFRAGCADDDPERFAASVDLPDGASWDDATWTFTWSTDLDDANPYELVVSARSVEASGSVPESAVASFSVADAYFDVENTLVDPAAYTSEWGLPVLHIDPQSTVGESYGVATATYRGVQYDMQVKLRGASSLEYAKKSYSLKFDDDAQLELSEEGLGNKKHVALISTFDDNSYVRQKLIYDTWQHMAEERDEFGLALRSFFCVLFLAGRYHGLYLVTDKVDDELMSQLGLNHDANLYKSVDHSANFYRTDYYGSTKSSLSQGYEKKEGTPEDGQPGAYADLEALVAFAADSSHGVFADEAEDWLPVELWMDWLLLVHYSASADSGGKNVYLYNDPADLRWYAHPWDFNHSWGQNWYTLRLGADTYDDFIWTNGIFWHFQEEPGLAATLNARLHASMDDGGPLATTTLLARMDDYYAWIGDSAQRDWDRWESSYQSEWWAGYRDDWTTFEEERAYVEDWIVEREDWIRFYDLGG